MTNLQLISIRLKKPYASKWHSGARPRAFGKVSSVLADQTAKMGNAGYIIASGA